MFVTQLFFCVTLPLQEVVTKRKPLFMPVPFDSKIQETALEKGNRAAWDESYRIWFRKLFNYGRKFSADEGLIEDVIQDIFVALWQQGDSRVRSLDGYLFTSFRNNLLRKISLNRQRGAELLNGDYHFELELAPDQQLISNERRDENARKIARAVAELTARQREFIFLRFYQQLSYEEISAVMDISVKAVYKLAARAIQLLRRELESEPFMLIATLLFSRRASR